MNGTFTNWEEMIRQFSRKVEKQEILNLKNKKGADISTKGLNIGHTSPHRGQYKPGLLEQSFDKSATEGIGPVGTSIAEGAAITQVYNKFEGKVDNTPYYSKPKGKQKFNS